MGHLTPGQPTPSTNPPTNPPLNLAMVPNKARQTCLLAARERLMPVRRAA
jgi:hypothetical protein